MAGSSPGAGVPFLPPVRGGPPSPASRAGEPTQHGEIQTMNKGTAIVGFFMSFLAGMFLMWGIDRSGGGVNIAAESRAAVGSLDHGSAVIPATTADPQRRNADAPVTTVEISAFECRFCARVRPTRRQLQTTT